MSGAVRESDDDLGDGEITLTVIRRGAVTLLWVHVHAEGGERDLRAEIDPADLWAHGWRCVRIAAKAWLARAWRPAP